MDKEAKVKRKVTPGKLHSNLVHSLMFGHVCSQIGKTFVCLLKVLTGLNPCVKVPVKGSLVAAIGIQCTTLEGFAQISMKVRIL